MFQVQTRVPSHCLVFEIQILLFVQGESSLGCSLPSVVCAFECSCQSLAVAGEAQLGFAARD